jgi:hypothetical protein
MERMHTTPVAVRVFEGAEDDIDFCRDISFSNVVAPTLTVEIAPHTVQSVTVLTRNAPENR